MNIAEIQKRAMEAMNSELANDRPVQNKPVTIVPDTPKEDQPVQLSKYDSSTDTAELAKRMDEIRTYLAMAENAQDYADEANRIVLFSKLSYGLRKSGEGLAKAMYLQRMAEVRRKEAEAVAFLDDFPEYAEKRELKSTDAARSHYIRLNDKVIKASEREAVMDAWVEVFSTSKQEFVQAIATLRAMIFGPKQSTMMSNFDSGSV